MKLRLAAAAIALALPSGLAAQELQINLDQALVENFDGNAVEEALVPFKVTATKRVSDTAAPAVDFTFAGGLVARAQPLACREAVAHTGCTGLELSVYFQPPEGKTPAEVAEIVNTFNAGHEATQVAYDKTGSTRLVRYVIADFGITKTNLVIQIYTFRQSAQALRDALFGKPAAAAQPGNS